MGVGQRGGQVRVVKGDRPVAWRQQVVMTRANVDLPSRIPRHRKLSGGL